jgi:hypothetical protein
MDRFDKDQVSEETGGREQEIDSRLTFSTSYSVGRRLTLMGRLPFSKRRIDDGFEANTSSGFSDPEVLALYSVSSSGPGSWLSLTAGVRAGWGVNNAQVNGERADEHLQPGTGAWGGQAGLSFARIVGEGDVTSIFGSVNGRVNGRNQFDYHYGNAVLANLGYERRLTSRLNGVVEVNFRHAAKDEPGIGETDENTGGSVVYVSPRLLVRVAPRLFFRLGVQVPVIKDLYGDQNEKVNILSGLTARF